MNLTTVTVSNFILSHILFKRFHEMSYAMCLDFWESGKECLKLFGRTKQSLWRWLHTFLLLQSCWMHWIPHATAWVQGTYVICCSKGNWWSWGTYLRNGEIERLVVESTGTWLEYLHRYNDLDLINSYGRRMELQLYRYLAVRTRHISQTIRATWRTGQYISVLETLTPRLDWSLRILQASLLPFFPFLRNITSKDMGKQQPNGDSSSHTPDVTPILGNKTAAGSVKAAMYFNNRILFEWFIVANNLTVHLVPRHLCMMASATFLWMTSSHLQARI